MKSGNIWRFLAYHTNDHNYSLTEKEDVREILMNPKKDKKITAKNKILSFLYKETLIDLPFNWLKFHDIMRSGKTLLEQKHVLAAVGVWFFQIITGNDLRWS